MFLFGEKLKFCFILWDVIFDLFLLEVGEGKEELNYLK